MFTGIVAAVGRIERRQPLGDGFRLTVNAGPLDLSDVAIGDSIAIQGACMTAVARNGDTFEVEVSRESLGKTVGLDHEGEVNLEKALRLSDRLAAIWCPAMSTDWAPSPGSNRSPRAGCWRCWCRHP